MLYDVKVNFERKINGISGSKSQKPPRIGLTSPNIGFTKHAKWGNPTIVEWLGASPGSETCDCTTKYRLTGVVPGAQKGSKVELSIIILGQPHSQFFLNYDHETGEFIIDAHLHISQTDFNLTKIFNFTLKSPSGNVLGSHSLTVSP
jgi:hypothetical protein